MIFSGLYSCLSVVMVFKRQLSYYVITIYIPTFLIVAVSWMSFFLDHKSVCMISVHTVCFSQKVLKPALTLTMHTKYNDYYLFLRFLWPFLRCSKTQIYKSFLSHTITYMTKQCFYFPWLWIERGFLLLTRYEYTNL